MTERSEVIQKSKYRPEIDGLRALSVVAVIMFHAKLDLFSGGFVGVDVFFVISGYLITGIIASSLERGDFSFGKFFESRVRRIVPGLLGNNVDSASSANDSSSSCKPSDRRWVENITRVSH